ncbi:hypothetical protein TNCV_1211051 [Trichonephila clavipes]|nr:hypothetical protein TNCV_1211051 [Trichonephila clavipes]
MSIGMTVHSSASQRGDSSAIGARSSTNYLSSDRVYPLKSHPLFPADSEMAYLLLFPCPVPSQCALRHSPQNTRSLFQLKNEFHSGGLKVRFCSERIVLGQRGSVFCWGNLKSCGASCCCSVGMITIEGEKRDEK